MGPNKSENLAYFFLDFLLIETRKKKQNKILTIERLGSLNPVKVFRKNVTATSLISVEEKVVILKFCGKLQESFL